MLFSITDIQLTQELLFSYRTIIDKKEKGFMAREKCLEERFSGQMSLTNPIRGQLVLFTDPVFLK